MSTSNDALDQEMFDDIERSSWKTSLMEKTREVCPGMSDSEILAFLRNDLGINSDVIVSYCMKHVDACFGLNYMQVAKMAGFHSSTLLACSGHLSDTSMDLPDVSHTVVAPETEELRMAEFAAENLESSVHNDRNFMPYCYKVSVDPDDSQTIRGYLLMHALASKTMFFFVGGSVVFPLIFLYVHSLVALTQVPSGLSFGAQLLYLHETMNLSGDAPRDLLVVLFVFCGFQFFCVVQKIAWRIINHFVGGALDQGLQLLSILRRG